MKTGKFCLICLGVVTAILTVSQQTSAQFTDTMGGTWNNPLSASTSTMIWNNIFYGIHRKAGANKGTTASTAAQPKSQPNKRIDDGVVRFRPSGTRIKTRELADQLGNTPAEREQYLKLMNAVLEGFEQQVQKVGLQNDLAMALSFFFGENARIYHGLPEPPDQQFVDLRNLIAGALANGGALNNTTDRQKQEMYEALVAYTGITQFGYEQAKQAGNETYAKGYQQVAGQNLQTVTHLSPDNINFTSAGLTISNAGDSPPPQPDSNGALVVLAARSRSLSWPELTR